MKKFNYPEEPILPFKGEHPAHGYGGHAARNWGRYSVLTIYEVTALSFGMNPLTCGSFWTDRNNYGTLHIGMWNDRITEISRAVHAGEIRKADTSNDISEKTMVYATDVEQYFQKQNVKDDDQKGKDETNDTKLNQEPKLHSRSKNTYLNIIAVLLEYISGQTPGVEKHPAFTNETKLIEILAEKYNGFDGLSKSNLSRKFPDSRMNFKEQ